MNAAGQHLYFLGIGGIGMSALARWFHTHGAMVAGYDRTPSTITDALFAEGMDVDTTGAIDSLPDGLKADLAAGRTERWTIVRTPAVPDHFPLLTLFRGAGFRILKRAELLGEVTRNTPLLAVAGTHGKTTTSALLAHLLHHGGVPVEAFLGGVAKGFDSNLLLAGQGHDAPWVVVEADEFDRSFLTLHPKHAVITSTDADHLDIYGDAAALHRSFSEFAGQVEEDGILLHVDASRALRDSLGPDALPQHTLYGEVSQDTLPEPWEGGYGDVGRDPSGLAAFDLHLTGHSPLHVTWTMPGMHNAANATAAAILAVRAGMDAAQIPQALQAFPGIARRFEVRLHTEALTIIDDYAHHPSEIDGTVAAARASYPGKKLVGVFQPHLFSRTRDFLDDFGRSLSALDHCIVLPIYAARENPLPGVDAQAVGDKVTGCPVNCPEESRFLDVLQQTGPEVLLFLGAGDLHHWIPAAADRLLNRPNASETTS
ncbi:MAG: UDP-N-acetylmuramate--L-alanine ligase [Crocinitomicaceae bacterium TMED114]|nr:MAG: UDP-N-acetylmuramate--L-alanine ligase [Crocinitomicaceae bacterium TMED114]